MRGSGADLLEPMTLLFCAQRVFIHQQGRAEFSLFHEHQVVKMKRQKRKNMSLSRVSRRCFVEIAGHDQFPCLDKNVLVMTRTL